MNSHAEQRLNATSLVPSPTPSFTKQRRKAGRGTGNEARMPLHCTHGYGSIRP